jgi:uncharacterized protein YneF (UPF0154 family)
MEALGALSPIEEVRAKLQEQIGMFLSNRARLNRLMGNPSLQVRGQAQGLYAVQTALETRLQNEITPKLQAVSSGVWDMSDIINLGAFTAQMMKQINDVNNLERQGGGGQSSSGLDMNTMAIGVPVLVVVGLIGGFLLARK